MLHNGRLLANRDDAKVSLSHRRPCSEVPNKGLLSLEQKRAGAITEVKRIRYRTGRRLAASKRADEDRLKNSDESDSRARPPTLRSNKHARLNGADFQTGD